MAAKSPRWTARRSATPYSTCALMGSAQSRSAAYSPRSNHSMNLKRRRSFEKPTTGCASCLSHENGRIGLLERENAAALNACLGDVAVATIQGIEHALRILGLNVPLFMSQNDGTLMDTFFAAQYPRAHHLLRPHQQACAAPHI